VFERPETTPEEIDLAMMRRALLAAGEAAERGEVPVGAVVANGGEILAVAGNEREATGDPTAHAELLAIRGAAGSLGGWRLSGCTLYVTLEPCPMCAGAPTPPASTASSTLRPRPKAGYAGTLHNTRPTPQPYPRRAAGPRSEAAECSDFFKNRRKRRAKSPEDASWRTPSQDVYLQ
jgi:tRNA(adenine34) deaminase